MYGQLPTGFALDRAWWSMIPCPMASMAARHDRVGPAPPRPLQKEWMAFDDDASELVVEWHCNYFDLLTDGLGKQQTI